MVLGTNRSQLMISADTEFDRTYVNLSAFYFNDTINLTYSTILTNGSLFISNNLTFVKIYSSLILSTLVDYGRRDANYFYSTYSLNESAQDDFSKGHKCNYIPEGRVVELNFLHKMFNVKPTLGLGFSSAYNATLSCMYPNENLVRVHLATNITKNDDGFDIIYRADRLKPDWDRIAYVGFDFHGKDFNISCSNFSYFIPELSNYVRVDSQEINFEAVDPNPVTVSYSNVFGGGFDFGDGVVYFPITFNFTNEGEFDVNDIAVDVVLPENGRFVSDKGEMFATAQNSYRFELNKLEINESFYLDANIRFDMENTNYSNQSIIDHIDFSYFPCWQDFSYNPLSEKYILTSNLTYGTDYNITSTPDDIIEILKSINNTVTNINKNVSTITTTVNSIKGDISTVITRINEAEEYIVDEVGDVGNVVGRINRKLSIIYNDILDTTQNNSDKLDDTLNQLPQDLQIIVDEGGPEIQEQAPSSGAAELLRRNRAAIGIFVWLMLLLLFTFFLMDYLI